MKFSEKYFAKLRINRLITQKIELNYELKHSYLRKMFKVDFFFEFEISIINKLCVHLHDFFDRYEN